MKRRTSMKRNTRPQDSICWDCKNARAHICPWIREKEKIWTRGTKEKRRVGYKAKVDGFIYVYIVEECKHFKPDKRKAVRW